MILGLEVALTVMGLMFLIRGKGLGNGALPHPHYRILGGFMLTVLPVALVLVIGFSVVWGVMHSDLPPDELEKRVVWPATGVEFLVVMSYAAITFFWEKSIKRKAQASQML